MVTDRAKVLTTVRIEQIAFEATGILRYVFVDPDGGLLERFEAGAHIDVHIGDDGIRQYSLCGAPENSRQYEIAVLRDEQGQGGSVALHEQFRAGDTVTISVPRNHFPLSEHASRHLLLAGGIGVTPMIAMIRELEAKGRNYEMHYCTRSPATTAFMPFLASRIEQGLVHIHHDNGNPAQGLDISALLQEQVEGTHLYFCGPGGFMEAVKTASSHWKNDTVHFEYFAAPVKSAELTAADTPFVVCIKDTGARFDVPVGKSIVAVLRENGFPVDTHCEDGYCGTCLTRYVEGEPDHRDVVLDAEDRSQFMLICCSRAKSKEIVLDI